MEPDNNALGRTYFIAGPPRVGKTLLSYKLAEKIHGHVVSTDAIRSAAKRACENKTGDLFRTNKENALSEEEWFDRHLNTPEIVVDDQIKEAIALWPSVVGFCNNFSEDHAKHIVEGVHLLPELVARMEHKPAHIVYVGNTNPNHIKSMVEYSSNNPVVDWMASLGYGEKKIEIIAGFVKRMSEYFKTEAEKYGLSYFEMSDDDFHGSLDKVCDFLMK
jgi:2-phosphoglycerate kinase